MRLETSFARTGRWGGRIAALTAALLTVASSAFATTVKSVSMKEAGTATQVIIEADAPINYHDFTLESPDRIVVDCPGSQLGFSERTWSGREGSSVKTVRASEMGWGKEAGARIVVDLSQASSYALSSVGNNLVLAVEVPPTPASKEPAMPTDSDRMQPTDGRRMSLDVQGADIQTVLRSLSEFSGKNIVASKEVKGEVTLRLRNVPWRHALDIVLKSQGLGMVETGQTIVVSNLDTLRKEEMDRRTAERTQEELLPLETRILPVNYAASKEMARSVEKTLTKRGHIEVDDRSNSLIVTDIADRLDQVDAMVRNLDTRTPQVEIVARLVDVDVSSTRDLGIQWGVHNLDLFDAGVTEHVDINAADVSNPAALARLGTIKSFGSIDARLQALESQNKANIISNPRITTVNNREASVVVGKQIPLIVQDFAGNAVTQLTTIGIKLNVTPHINTGNRITMDVHPEVSDLASQATVQGGIIINTTMADTRVMVNDGETAVIGGLIRSNESTTKRGVPVLMDVPLLGNLFRSNSTTKQKRELLIFVTPKILGEGIGSKG
ncbi:MAG: AMIN domain-containing protein [Candidatus Eisenbacteria bacterium]|uniref:AMIN domain-containing protein n=1 Tax=Eiseniibacteriota bacterium TaxID=2212470 RepID=A0A538SQI0_UNCEI|nr:MAG: AMIN domain-containing protein [Candidatus Eisenbacteria bacterium]TMQ67069.1 MAG: AMIN domain-containing protein [Candidatus Eisenbacteria bacterium]